jgi:hypothetical protein
MILADAVIPMLNHDLLSIRFGFYWIMCPTYLLGVSAAINVMCDVYLR